MMQHLFADIDALPLPVFLALMLTATLVVRGVLIVWACYRCRTRGHRWRLDGEGVQCRRCGDTLRDGDTL